MIKTTVSGFPHMVKMQNFSGVPLVGLGSQQVRSEGSRQDVDVHLAPCYGYSTCTPCARTSGHKYCCSRALQYLLHPIQQNSLHANRRCYACNRLGHIARFCPSPRRAGCRHVPFDQPSGHLKIRENASNATGIAWVPTMPIRHSWQIYRLPTCQTKIF